VARFVAWATGNALSIDAKGDGPFGVRSRLVIGGGQVAAQNMVGTLSGTSLNGTAHYKWEGRPEIAVALEGPLIDARGLVPAGSGLADVFGFLLRGPEDSTGEARGPKESRRDWRGQTDLLLRLSAGQLATGSRVYRDVTAQAALKSGQLTG